MPRLSKAPLLQLPDSFSSPSRVSDQSDPLHYFQMFADRLTRDIGPFCKPCDGHRPVIAEPQNQLQARFIAQRREDRRRLRGSLEPSRPIAC